MSLKIVAVDEPIYGVKVTYDQNLTVRPPDVTICNSLDHAKDMLVVLTPIDVVQSATVVVTSGWKEVE